MPLLLLGFLCSAVLATPLNADTVSALPIVPITTSTFSDLTATLGSATLPAGIRNSLSSKVATAEAAYERGNTTAAINIARALINELQAQSGKSIPAAIASQLIAVASNIVVALRSGLRLGGSAVGPAGAILKVTDANSAAYGTTLIIPPNALSTSVSISMSVPDATPLVGGIAFPGSGVRLEPDGLTFSSPATLVLPYPDLDDDGLVDGTDILADALKIGAQDSTGSIGFLRSTVDTVGKTQTAQIGHFSFYWNVVWRSPQTLTYRMDWPASGILAAPGFTQEALQNAIRRAVEVWTAVLAQAGVTVQEVAPDQPAYFRFAVVSTTASFPLAGTTYPQDAISGGPALVAIDNGTANVVMNVWFNASLPIGLAWTPETGGSTTAMSLEAVAVHALGHVMGLNDSIVDTEPPVMAPNADLSAPETCLFPDDVNSFRTLYGVPAATPFPACPDAGISVTPSAFDFGPTPIDTSARKLFTVISAGTGTLLLSGVSVTGAPAFSIDASGLPPFLRPNASATFAATFAATTPGLQQATVTVAGNAVGSPTGVALSGFGGPMDPIITSLNPTSGGVGQAVTITGTNFGSTQDSSTVTFNGIAAPVNGWSAALIIATVPAGSTTGPLVVSVNGHLSNGLTFAVIPPPNITSVNPASGTVGQTVTMTGTNFGATRGLSSVTFNGTAASITSWSATSIVVTAPIGATTGPVVVTVNGQASNGWVFTAAPVIMSIDPTSVIRGQSLTINGLNFGATQGTGTVTFGGTLATVVGWTASSITAMVPAGANTSKVVVTANGFTSNAVTVIVTPPPSMTALKPASGTPGQLVSISGANLGDSQGSSTVTFNGMAAAVTFWSATAIHAIVPSGTTSGPVVTSVNGQPSNSLAFTLLADTNPLTITAQTTPAPNATGWYVGNVTVTFTCTDADFPVTTCPPSATIYQDGSELLVSGEAVDSAGNRASITLALNVDRVSPGLTVYSPKADVVLPGGTTTAIVKGSAYDFTSGLASVRCNGMPATVTAQSYSCPAPVVEGTNTVHLEAQDRAGHVTTKDVTVMVGDVPPVSIAITPASMTIVAGDTRLVAVTDERGRLVVGGTWTVSNSVVAQVVVDDGGTSVRGLSGGTATVTFALNSLTAHASVTVLAAGTTLSGTLWSVDGSTGALADCPGCGNRAEVVRAVGVDAPVGSIPAALFYVEYGLQEWVSTTTIRAVTADGRQLWTYSTRNSIKHVAADNYGGILLDIGTRYPANGLDTRYAIRRLDGFTGNVSWEYIPQGDGDAYYQDKVHLTELALHPDGRVFFIEQKNMSADLVAFDSQTGGTSGRWRLGPQLRTYTSGQSTITPLIREDGSVAVIQLQVAGDIQGTRRLMMFELADGADTLTATEINTGTVNLAQMGYLDRAIPDGHNGLLLSAPGTGSVYRIADGALSQPLLFGLGNYLGRSENVVEYVVGPTSAYALAQQWSSGLSGAKLVEFDPMTLAIRNATNLSGGPNLHLQAALAGAGVEYSGPGFGNAAQVGLGIYTSWPGPILQIGPEDAEATSEWAYVRGNPQNANAGVIPNVVTFVPLAQLREPGFREYSAEELQRNLSVSISGSSRNRLRSLSIIKESATAATFKWQVAQEVAVVAFIGHSFLGIGPDYFSIGLAFADKNLAKRQTGFEWSGVGNPVEWVDTIPSRARVIFIGACHLGEEFKSLWGISTGTSGRALIVTANEHTNLFAAAKVWVEIATRLALGDTVQQAVASGNFEAAFNLGIPDLQWQVVGDGSIRVRQP